MVEFTRAGYANRVSTCCEVRRKREHGTRVYFSSKKCDVSIGVTWRVLQVTCGRFLSRKRYQLRCDIRRNGSVDSPCATAGASHERKRGTRLRMWFECATDPT
jgi:hypothetical protein